MGAVVLCSALFSLGLYGVLTRREVVAVLASVEVMLGAAVLQLVALARLGGLATARQASAQGLALVILAIAAAEAAVGLALVVTVARRGGRVRMEEIAEVKG